MRAYSTRHWSTQGFADADAAVEVQGDAEPRRAVHHSPTAAVAVVHVELDSPAILLDWTFLYLTSLYWTNLKDPRCLKSRECYRDRPTDYAAEVVVVAAAAVVVGAVAMPGVAEHHPTRQDPAKPRMGLAVATVHVRPKA